MEMNDIGRNFEQEPRELKRGAWIVNVGLFDAMMRRQIDHNAFVTSGLQPFMNGEQVGASASIGSRVGTQLDHA